MTFCACSAYIYFSDVLHIYNIILKLYNFYFDIKYSLFLKHKTKFSLITFVNLSDSNNLFF